MLPAILTFPYIRQLLLSCAFQPIMALFNRDSAPTSSIPSPSATSTFLATQSAFIGVATLLVVARIYVRSVIIKNVGLDDFFVVVALVESLIANVYKSR